jgi:hypothetical protein
VTEEIMSVRIGSALIGASLVLALAACASSSTSGASGLSAAPAATPSPSAATVTAQPAASGAAPASTAATTAPPATSAPTPVALTCKDLRYAQVGSKTISYNGYHDSIPLGGGVWSGEDGTTVTLLKPCAIGDLNGDGVAEAVGAVVATSAGTGQFYTLVVWRNVGGKPVFTALADLSDRNPVQSISIANGKATVVYLTRTADAPMAEVNIKRTAVFKLSGHTFTAQSHTDVPYTSN